MKYWVEELIGVIFVCVLGVISHFLYEWSGDSRLIAMFVPVNESIFEHLKILFFPYLVWCLIQYFILGKKESNYICAHVIGVVMGMLFIIVAFYTYSGIIGENFVVIDILIYVLSVILTFLVSDYLTHIVLPFGDKMRYFTMITLFLILIGFAWFTFSPIRIDLFKDPLTGTYGVN